MDFRLLHTRLLTNLRVRVRNGEITERALARSTGISQPHLHNVLKGARLLSTGMADQILDRLHIDLTDLLVADDRTRQPGEAGEVPECRAVPLLDGYIGPGFPYPQTIGQSKYPFLVADVARLDAPVAAWLAPGSPGPLLLNAGGVALLDMSAEPRLNPGEESYFALDLLHESAIGRVRHEENGWRIWSPESGDWQPAAVHGHDALDWIKGRVHVVIGRL